MQYTIISEKDVEVPMRDGTILRADIYRLQNTGPSAVLLTRTPYGKDSCSVNWQRFIKAGYMLVVQDTRGRYSSDGDANLLTDEGVDGYDTVEWAAVQPWSNGRVGMMGGSYLGATQWLAAMEKPPHLEAIAPFFTASDYYEGWSHQGGAFQLGAIQWSLGNGNLMAEKIIQKGIATQNDRNQLIAALLNFPETLKKRPMNCKPMAEKFAPWLNEWMNHRDYDDYWKRISPQEHYKYISIPILNVGGWFDCFLGGTLENYKAMSERRDMQGKKACSLIIGPWCHSASSGAFLDFEFGQAASLAALDPDGILLRFFDYWLLSKDNGFDMEPPVKYFLMGDNVWKTTVQWPPSEVQSTLFYLHSGGSANSLYGDGILNTVMPGQEQEDVYLFDPRNPVPTKGGQTLLPTEGIVENAGPRDQRDIEMRLDVLCYTSELLIERMEVVGPVRALIYASSSAKDTDWTVKLVDVHPDGRSINLTDGILRARYRNSFERPELLQPGKVYEFSVDMWATANVFLPGHRIRMEISSSSYPRFEVNTNTGGIVTEETDFVQALNRIYHTEEYPSHVILQVMPANNN